MNEQLKSHLIEQIGRAIDDRILPLFKADMTAKVTVLVRFEGAPDCDVVVTSDDDAGVRAIVDRRFLPTLEPIGRVVRGKDADGHDLQWNFFPRPSAWAIEGGDLARRYGAAAAFEVYAAPTSAPVAEPVALTDGWAEAYAAFQGAFDTPLARRRDDSEYAQDARRRLRAFNEATLAAPPAPQADLTTCNCRWRGDVQVQHCELHQAHIDAIHEWAERAKTAEAKVQTVPHRNRLDDLGFELRQSEGVWLLVDDCGNEREATLNERVLWGALLGAQAPAPVAEPVALTGAPERIWLNLFDTPEDTDGVRLFPSDHEGITWAEEEVGDYDVQYVRADLAAHPSPVAEEAKDAARKLKTLADAFADSKAECWCGKGRGAEDHGLWERDRQALHAAIDAALSQGGGS